MGQRSHEAAHSAGSVPPLALCVCVIGVKGQQTPQGPGPLRLTGRAPSGLLCVGRNQRQRAGARRTGEVEQTPPEVAMATRGGESDGGEAQLRANSQPQVLQDGSLEEMRNSWAAPDTLSAEGGRPTQTAHLVTRAHREVLHRRDETLGDQLAVRRWSLPSQKFRLHPGQLGLKRPEQMSRQSQSQLTGSTASIHYNETRQEKYNGLHPDK